MFRGRDSMAQKLIYKTYFGGNILYICILILSLLTANFFSFSRQQNLQIKTENES